MVLIDANSTIRYRTHSRAVVITREDRSTAHGRKRTDLTHSQV